MNFSMVNYSKIYHEQISKIHDGVKTGTSIKRIDRSTKLTDNAKKLLKISIIQSIYLRSAPSVIKTELGVTEDEASALASLAEGINEFAGTDRFNLLILVLDRAGCINRNQAKNYFFYFRLCNPKDFNYKKISELENSNPDTINSVLFNTESTVKHKCHGCGEEKFLHEFKPGGNICKSCKKAKVKRTFTDTSTERVISAVESMNHANIEREDNSEQHSIREYIEEINKIKAFYSDVCSKLFCMTDNPNKLDKLLDKLNAINVVIKKEIE